MPGSITVTHRSEPSPADQSSPDPVRCFRCKLFEVAQEGDMCGRCGAEVDEWHWQVWAETNLEVAQ